MDRNAAIARLRAHEAELRAMGVSGLSLFGSVARGEAGPDSDVDLAARFDPAAEVGMFKYGAILERLRTAPARTASIWSASRPAPRGCRPRSTGTGRRCSDMLSGRPPHHRVEFSAIGRANALRFRLR